MVYCFVCGKQQPCYDHFYALTNGEKQHVSSDSPGTYVMLITGKQSNTNLTEHVPIRKKGDQGSEHASMYVYPECILNNSVP